MRTAVVRRRVWYKGKMAWGAERRRVSVFGADKSPLETERWATSTTSRMDRSCESFAESHSCHPSDAYTALYGLSLDTRLARAQCVSIRICFVMDIRKRYDNCHGPHVTPARGMTKGYTDMLWVPEKCDLPCPYQPATMTIFTPLRIRRQGAQPATYGVHGALLRRRAGVLVATVLLTLVGAPRSVSGQAPSGSRSPGNTAAAPFSVKVIGRGPAMIFVPGLTNGGAVWDDIVSVFADQYECHVFTLAGFAGQPPIPADSTWLPHMREAIIGYIRERQLARPVIVGHSLGGFLALDIAATAPSIPRAIVNVDGLPFLAATMSPNSTVNSIRPMAEQMRRMMLAQTGAEQGQQMQEMQLRALIRDTTKLPLARAMGRASDAATVAEAMYGLYVTDLRPQLARISAPVLNLHAWIAYKAYGQTREGMERMLEGQYSALRTSTTRVSDLAYHFIMFDEPQWLVDEMRTFLAAHP